MYKRKIIERKVNKMKGFIKGLAQWIFIALSMYAILGSAISPCIGFKLLSILLMVVVPIIILLYRYNPSAPEAEREEELRIIATCTLIVFVTWLPIIMYGIMVEIFPK